jgi:cell division protein FtsI/penicillin-binding protein 2
MAALAGTAPLPGDEHIQTTLDPELTQRVHRALEIGRVSLGHVILMQPGTGRVLAWASTDPERFPPTRTYPAASLIKVVTAAAALDRNPELLRRPCRYQGSPWRLNRQRIDPPLRGVESSFQKALAISNNQCFAQIAVNDLGADALLGAIERFGWLEPPAPGYAAGSADAGDDRFDLGKLGCGLAGCRITPLHAVQMAGILADGWLREPRWIESMTDAQGRVLALPPPRPARQVLTPELAKRMREMLIDTTARGTARSAFRDRRGRPILGSIQVAGKTGSLSGRDPDGRYEWFMGVAPADQPEVALAVVLVQGPRWWRSASQIAADVLKQRFCPKTTCR